jgi:hypothetical protein
MSMQGYEAKWNEYFSLHGSRRNKPRYHGPRNQKFKDFGGPTGRLKHFVIWNWPSYVYLEHSDDNNDLRNDMLRSNAENHPTATGVKSRRTASCAALPLNTFQSISYCTFSVIVRGLEF